MGPSSFEDDFDGPGLDTDVWVPHYLMVAVFDFPERAASAPAGHEPVLAVDLIRGPASAQPRAA